MLTSAIDIMATSKIIPELQLSRYYTSSYAVKNELVNGSFNDTNQDQYTTPCITTVFVKSPTSSGLLQWATLIVAGSTSAHLEQILISPSGYSRRYFEAGTWSSWNKKNWGGYCLTSVSFALLPGGGGRHESECDTKECEPDSNKIYSWCNSCKRHQNKSYSKHRFWMEVPMLDERVKFWMGRSHICRTYRWANNQFLESRCEGRRHNKKILCFLSGLQVTPNTSAIPERGCA